MSTARSVYRPLTVCDPRVGHVCDLCPPAVRPQDKKTVESVCLAFSRLVETFKTDPAKVKEIARHGLLANVQRLVSSGRPT